MKEIWFVTDLNKNKNQKTILIHRLIAQTFIPNSENKLEVNHIDGNKQNNNIENLEWCTKSENHKHAFKIGLCKPNNIKGDDHSCSKLNSFQVKKIKKIFKNNNIWGLKTKIAKEKNISPCTISDIIYGRSWKHI